MKLGSNNRYTGKRFPFPDLKTTALYQRSRIEAFFNAFAIYYTERTRDAAESKQQAAMICKTLAIMTNRNSALETTSSSTEH